MAKRRRLTPLATSPKTGAADPLETEAMPFGPPGAPLSAGSAAAERRAGAPPASRSLPPIAGMAGNAALAAAAEDLAETLRTARATGRLVVDLPLETVDAAYLVRDRTAVDEAEMRMLVELLRLRGQQTPIEVAPLPGGRYGLISGWRRMHALARLHEETGEARFAVVQARIRPPAEAPEAYLAMVEENEIRVGLSHYERARIALRTVDQGVFDDEGAALRCLFHAASRPRRSKIRSFLAIVRALDGALRHPEAIGERLGLRLAGALEADPGLGPRLRARLAETGAARISDAAAEQRAIAELLETPPNPKPTPDPDRGSGGSPARVQIAPGLRLDTAADNTLKLSGTAVDPAFRARLLAWLSGAPE